MFIVHGDILHSGSGPGQKSAIPLSSFGDLAYQPQMLFSIGDIYYTGSRSGQELAIFSPPSGTRLTSCRCSSLMTTSSTSATGSVRAGHAGKKRYAGAGAQWEAGPIE